MVSLAFRQMRVSRHVSAVMPSVLRRWEPATNAGAVASFCRPRHLITGHSPAELSDDEITIPFSKPKKPRRRWMSVSDLVTEVEKAMLKGVELDKDGPTYANLDTEMQRLRSDNDAISEAKAKIKVKREMYV